MIININNFKLYISLSLFFEIIVSKIILKLFRIIILIIFFIFNFDNQFLDFFEYYKFFLNKFENEISFYFEYMNLKRYNFY